MTFLWRAPDRNDRQVAVLWAVCAGLLILLRPALSAGATLVPGCPWRALSGWPCPGCGTTRAILHLLEADPAGALAHNPLAAAGALSFVAGGLAAPVWLLCGGKAIAVAGRPGLAATSAAALVVVANWAWLAIAGV